MAYIRVHMKWFRKGQWHTYIQVCVRVCGCVVMSVLSNEHKIHVHLKVYFDSKHMWEINRPKLPMNNQHKRKAPHLAQHAYHIQLNQLSSASWDKVQTFVPKIIRVTGMLLSIYLTVTLIHNVALNITKPFKKCELQCT